MGLHPVILAGGSGTRMWPLSRELYPKQFLPLLSERSILQETLLRFDGVEGVQPPVIVCNEEHRFLVAEHARQLGKRTSSILLEPKGRNTAPALTLAALSLAASNGSDDPVMLVTPADHVIGNVQEFQSAIRKGAALAQDGCLVTFGIIPTAPETGYGYIKRGQGYPSHSGNGTGRPAYAIESFVEKPDKATAQEMLKSEDYLWNSGIFMMRASVWLDEIKTHRPDIAEACRAAHLAGRADGDFYRPDRELFLKCPSDSIDYAVMERAAGRNGSSLHVGVVLPLDAGWSDLGAWSSVWEEGAKDASGNVVQGDVYAHSMRDSLLIASSRLLAAVGLEDVIVIETADAVLVAHKDRVQDVKALVSQLKADGRVEQENHRRVHRPWGTYEVVDVGPRFQVKRLTVNPGAALSLQMHHHRAEHWVVVKGTAKVTRGEESFLLTEDQSTYVSVGMKHRLENPGTIPLELIEVQSGSYLGEDDIVRFEDRYNRDR